MFQASLLHLCDKMSMRQEIADHVFHGQFQLNVFLEDDLTDSCIGALKINSK